MGVKNAADSGSSSARPGVPGQHRQHQQRRREHGATACWRPAARTPRALATRMPAPTLTNRPRPFAVLAQRTMGDGGGLASARPRRLPRARRHPAQRIGPPSAVRGRLRGLWISRLGIAITPAAARSIEKTTRRTHRAAEHPAAAGISSRFIKIRRDAHASVTSRPSTATTGQRAQRAVIRCATWCRLT